MVDPATPARALCPTVKNPLHNRVGRGRNLAYRIHKHMITTAAALADRRAIVSYYFSAVLADPSLTMPSSHTSAKAQPSPQKSKRSSRAFTELYTSLHMRQSG